MATPSSPSPSLEVTAVATPKTRLKGKSKIGQSVWDDPATALGCAHNVITNDELKSLSSIPSHELVSQHIHKLVQVLGVSLHITTNYLNIEEKVVAATSKAESVEVECSQLKNDLITIMNERNEANQKIKELTNALRVEKALVIQKDEEIQSALLKTDEERAMKHHSAAINFSNLDFEKIDIEILEDESKEPEKDTSKETEIDESGIPEKDKVTEGESPAPPS
nr:hypothetical protein CFP56_46519 [Quercus suber]